MNERSVRSLPVRVPPVRVFPFAALLWVLGWSGPVLAQSDPALQPELQGESAIASGGGTGFVEADGGYGALPPQAPGAKARPLDPEEREDPDTPLTEAEEGPDAAPAGRVPVYRQLAVDDATFLACTRALEALGARFEPAPPITEARDRDCGIARPLLVTEIVPGIAMRPDALMRCETARELAQWTQTHVVPAAERLGRGAVTAIEHGSTYVCRRRNNAATGKLSEHSFGNAVDVMGFRFAEGDPLRIEPREGSAAGRFQATVRRGSCEHFTTVLGPGSNAAHANHLHLDIKARSGGYRLCQ